MGKRALQWRLVSRVLHPERFAIVEEKFQRHGSWMIFFCRFLPGIRIPGYFSAGTLRMSFVRFLVLDGLGVLISVPTSIWIAKAFGGQVEKMEEQMENFHLILAFSLVAILSILGFRILIRRRDREAQALAVEPEESRSDS
jgi:membrane protein DedA with SNARE-associated domain